MVRLTDRPDMTLDVYGGRKTTKQQQQLRDTGKCCHCQLNTGCLHAVTETT